MRRDLAGRNIEPLSPAEVRQSFQYASSGAAILTEARKFAQVYSLGEALAVLRVHGGLSQAEIMRKYQMHVGNCSAHRFLKDAPTDRDVQSLRDLALEDARVQQKFISEITRKLRLAIALHGRTQE